MTRSELVEQVAGRTSLSKQQAADAVDAVVRTIEETLAAGGEVAIVNRGPTPYDSRASLRIDGSAGEILPAVAAAV